ncbi:MAG: AAA family ATPase [Gemmataceae bacterium]
MTDDASRNLADDSPLHGYQGDRLPPQPAVPVRPSLAVSRDVGARGGAIARRVSSRLGWPVYDREMLEYASQDSASWTEILRELPPESEPWIEGRLQFLHRHQVMTAHGSFERVARLILALAAKGEMIFVGQGAGFVLPRETTLHVRMTAPLPDRVAYFSQWLRLPRGEAAEQVRVRSQRRDAFLAACFNLPSDGILYDMMLNSSALGEELCADLIVQALRCKCAAVPDPDEGD